MNLAPFRLGLRRLEEVDYTAWSDHELIERVRELLPALVNSWRAGRDREDAYLLERALGLCPDLSGLLSDQETHDLGV